MSPARRTVSHVGESTTPGLLYHMCMVIESENLWTRGTIYFKIFSTLKAHLKLQMMDIWKRKEPIRISCICLIIHLKSNKEGRQFCCSSELAVNPWNYHSHLPSFYVFSSEFTSTLRIFSKSSSLNIGNYSGQKGYADKLEFNWHIQALICQILKTQLDWAWLQFTHGRPCHNFNILLLLLIVYGS